ncbi:MAG: PEP-CTERM sorting domain-containing protein [Woeseia sp.]
MATLRKVSLALVALAWTPVVGAFPIPSTLPWLPFDIGGGINFDDESCCISYDATTDLLLAVSSGQMTWFDDPTVSDSSLSFDGTWLLEAHIDELFQVTDPGSVSLFGDVGDGLEQLIAGRVTHIGFEENFTELDEPTLFYGAFFMQIAFQITTGNDLITSPFDLSASFLTGHRIGDDGFFEPGDRNDSPFAQDFRCGTNAFRCELAEGSYGINPVTQIPEPGTGALLGIGLAAMGFVRRRKKS